MTLVFLIEQSFVSSCTNTQICTSDIHNIPVENCRSSLGKWASLETVSERMTVKSFCTGKKQDFLWCKNINEKLPRCELLSDGGASWVKLYLEWLQKIRTAGWQPFTSGVLCYSVTLKLSKCPQLVPQVKYQLTTKFGTPTYLS